MFRIKENADGSVSIFSNDENQEFICAIAARTPTKTCPKITDVPTKTTRKKNVPSSPTRLTLSPRRSKRKKCFSGKEVPVWSSNQSKQNGYGRDDDDASSVSSYKSTTSSDFSFASTISIESSTEPDEDCLDLVNFCRMLDLVESKRLCVSGEAFMEVQRTFPIRKIACQSRWQDKEKRFQKLTDSVGFSSLLSRKISERSNIRGLLESGQVLRSKYEKFCKSSVITMQTLVSSSPYLRTREPKARFQVTYKKVNGYIHHYSFNKKQRKQRAKSLNLGLSQQSYLLKSKCKKCSVRLPRLSQATINRYCNPPSKKLQNAHSPREEFKSQRITCDIHKSSLPNGTSDIEPVVCLESDTFVTRLLRKFGPVQA